MKKIACILISLLLVSGVCLAMAEEAALNERTRSILMQGEAEEIMESLYVSPDGYELWYDVNAFKPSDTDGVTEFVPVDPDALPPVSLTIVKAEISADEADDLLNEGLADHTEGGWDMGDIYKDELDNKSSYQVCEGQKDGVVIRLYMINGAHGVYCATATFPEDSIEGYGARLDIMVKTLSD